MNISNPSVTGVQVEEHFLFWVLTKLLKQGFAQAQLFCDVDLPLRCETTMGLLQKACHDLPGTESVMLMTANVTKTRKKRAVQCDLSHSKMSVCGFDYSAVTNIQESHQVTWNHTI